MPEPINFDLLTENGLCSCPITIADSHIFSIDAMNIQFQEPVILENTAIEKADGSFMFSYFLKGLNFENCLFQDKTDFQCGVHNNFGNLELNGE